MAMTAGEDWRFELLSALLDMHGEEARPSRDWALVTAMLSLNRA
jgi:hypothetical protein